MMLSVQDLTVHYGSTLAISHVDLAIDPGRIVAIVGESGSGKSTLIRSVMGLLPSYGRISSGKIILNGRDISTIDAREWRAIRGSQVAMIFQDTSASLNPIRRIGSQLCEYIRQHRDISSTQAWKLASDMLASLGLPDPDDLMRRYPFQLSGGMSQRVGIAMAMMLEPQLLLADEPTSALDTTTQAQIVEEMMRLRDQSKTAIVMVTHNMALACYMADEIMVMQKGKVVDRGDRIAIMNNSAHPYTKNLLASMPTMYGERYV